MARDVIVINNERDRKILELRGEGKKRQEWILGSKDDEGKADCAQPRLTFEADVWTQLKKQRAVKALIESGKIAEYAAVG